MSIRNDPAYRELAAMIVDLQERFKGLSTNQLGHSSLENTGLPTYDENGQISGMIGRLPDGSYGSATLSGPPPPIPSAPKVRAIRGVGLEIEWDGLFEDAQAVVPLTGGRLEVYVHDDVNITPILAPAYTIESPRGGKFLISVGYDQTHYVAFAFRASSGKVSPASAVVGPCTVGRATKEDLEIDFDGLRGSRIHFGIDEPETNVADLWLRPDADGPTVYTALRYVPDLADWVELQDQGVVGALLVAEAAQAAADLKAQVFSQSSPPTGLTETDRAIWIDIDDGNVSYSWSGSEWTKRQIGNGAIEPKSLVASDVIATGTVTAALFEALLILATEIIAGNPLGSHARMTPQGFRVYRADLNGDGAPDEVVRMGTETNDYFGIVDAAGNLVAAIDDTGRGSFKALSTSELRVDGRLVEEMIDERARGIVAYFQGNLPGNLGPIFFDVGIAEMGATLRKGRNYRITWRVQLWAERDDAQARFAFRMTSGADGDTITNPPAPTINTPAHTEWHPFLGPTFNKPEMRSSTTVFTSQKTARYRFGLTVGVGPDSALTNLWVSTKTIEITIEDIGPALPLGGAFSRMGGSLQGGSPTPPPPVTQSYFVDLAPVGRASWTGSGAHMNWVGGDVYQGYHSSNGDTRGMFWFDLPNITGTVDRVDVWLYFRHWHFNSGGTVRMGLTDQRGVFTAHTFRPTWETGGWPKPGGREVLLPADWWPFFRGTDNNSFNGRATCITLGPGGGTNQLFYGVATDARLRIHYTQ